MKLSVGNHLTTIEDISEEEMDWLEDLLSIKEPVFRKDYRTGRMVQKGSITHTFVKNNKIPSGFIRLINKLCKKEGYALNITDDRDPLPVQLVDLNLPVVNTFQEELPLLEAKERGEHVTPWIRYYQEEAIRRVVERRRGILWHVTAAGKTNVAVYLTMRIPAHWLFIVRDTALLHNAADRYKSLTGLEANIIGDGCEKINPESKFTVAMAQTLDRRRNDKTIWGIVRSAEGLMVDECHELPGNQTMRIANATEKAVYRIGLSGSPLDRSDAKGLATIGALGSVIHRVRADELIDKGFLSEAKIKFIKHKGKCVKPTYQGAYGDLIVRSASRNDLLCQIMSKAQKPALCFVKQVNHGKELLKKAQKAGINCGFVWGEKDTKQRNAAVEQLICGELDVLICNVIFQQGIDIPELRAIIRGSAGKSTISTLQVIGRGMRITSTKKSFEYWDIYDEENKWMESHAKQRKKSLERDGHKVHIMRMEDA